MYIKNEHGPDAPSTFGSSGPIWAQLNGTARTAVPKATEFIESMMMMTLMREGCRIGCSANPPRIVLRLSRSHKHCRSINLCKSKNAITVCDTELNTFVRYRTRGMATEKDKWAIISKMSVTDGPKWPNVTSAKFQHCGHVRSVKT